MYGIKTTIVTAAGMLLLAGFASAQSSASFIAADTTTQGNWTSAYGSEGYSISGDASLKPAYASPAFTGSNSWVWTDSTSDPRGLRRAPGTGSRLGASWFSSSSFTIDLNLTDSASHQVALYCVDWDFGGRAQDVDVLAPNGAVLDHRSLNAGFTGGVYLVWNVAGPVKFRLTNLTYNAVVSGLFFGKAAGSASSSAAATFLRTDTATQGNWSNSYGAEGYSMAGDGSVKPAYAAPAFAGSSSWVWSDTTLDSRGLRKAAGNGSREAATWYSSSTFNVDLNLTDSVPHQVALYCVDWDSGGGRSQDIDVLGPNGAVLDHRSLNTGFTGGVYLVWSVSGPVKFRITNLGYNAVVSGVFFGGASAAAPVPSAGATASFLRTDTTTQGNWRAGYGADGYSLAGDGSLNSTYAAPVLQSQSTFTWAASITDTRALQKAAASDRVASTWYSSSAFTIATNIADTAVHQVALYCVDWENAGRAQDIDVLGPDGTVLDHRSLRGFSGGVYLVWNVTGPVKFRITNLGYNAVASGLFFGAAGAPPVSAPPVAPPPVSGPPAAAPPIPQLATWQSRMLSGGANFCSSATIAAAVGAGGVATEGNVWYYDGTKVYQQIAAYTSDPSWLTCAGYVNKAYTDWVLATSAGASGPVGSLQGWRLFPDGALKDAQRNATANSRQAVLRLAANSAFAGSGGGADQSLSRETAYLINSYIAAEKLGQPRNPLLAQSVTYALGHLDQWFVSKSSEYAPFMVGLTMEALINYYELTSDQRIPAAIQTALDGMWSGAWISGAGAFGYSSVSDRTPSPDLNLLIAPAYAWMWQLTGTQRFQDNGDQVFAGGVLGAGFWSGKQFSQSYRTSFNYVKWRSAPAKSIVPLTGFSY